MSLLFKPTLVKPTAVEPTMPKVTVVDSALENPPSIHSHPLLPTHSHCAVHTTQATGEVSIEQRVNQARQSCQARGLRFTALREAVFRVILQATAPIGAYDILAQLQQQQPPLADNDSQKAIAPPTVYRSLDFLLTHGFIHQLNSANAFIPCCHPREKHSVAFLICAQCGKVEEFSADSIASLLHSVQSEANFMVQTSVIEISGVCHQCQNLPLLLALQEER